MGSNVPDEDLWSLVDRGGAAIEAHLARHPDDRSRVAELRGAIGTAASAIGRASTPLPLPGRIGKYRIEREIGRGGGGVVYEAWQEDPPRRVARKVLRDADHADAAALARMRREAEALGRLSHPHVATIFEAGFTDDGHPFLAMELVHGPTLSAHVRDHALGVRARVQLFRDICEGVHHAHRQGVIHRDLKSSNVLVDDELGVKVVDFGLARFRDTAGVQVTQTGIVVGTLGYMSPEQALGEEVDERADVYALGVVLYELLTDSLPFDLRGKNALDVVRIISEARPTPLRSRKADVDRDLETIVMKAMEKEPEQRYGSVAALAEDVGCWLGGRPILARRPSLGYRLRKLAGRNRLVTALLAVMILLGLFGGYMSVLKPRLIPLSGDWYATRTPFDGLAWVGESPEVLVNGTWYELVSIDGLKSEYIIGFCKQEVGRSWRKRFSEDLLQVLNLMGDWPIRGVDLEVRERDTGRIVMLPRVPLDHDKRQAIMRDRNAWPLESSTFMFQSPASRPIGSDFVRYDGREFELVSIDGVSVEALPPEERRSFTFSYDSYCRIAGRSPGPTLRLEMRDVATGNIEVFEDVPRERRPRQPAAPR